MCILCIVAESELCEMGKREAGGLFSEVLRFVEY